MIICIFSSFNFHPIPQTIFEKGQFQVHSIPTTFSDILQTVPSVDVSHTIPSSSSEDDSSIGPTPVLMGMFKKDKGSCYVHWKASDTTAHCLGKAEKYATIASEREKDDNVDGTRSVKFLGNCYSSSNLDLICSPNWVTRKKKASNDITGELKSSLLYQK